MSDLKVNPKIVKPDEVFIFRQGTIDTDIRLVGVAAKADDLCCKGCVGHMVKSCRVLPVCCEDAAPLKFIEEAKWVAEQDSRKKARREAYALMNNPDRTSN